jgi:hypothetical protein
MQYVTQKDTLLFAYRFFNFAPVSFTYGKPWLQTKLKDKETFALIGCASFK